METREVIERINSMTYKDYNEYCSLLGKIDNDPKARKRMGKLVSRYGLNLRLILKNT